MLEKTFLIEYEDGEITAYSVEERDQVIAELKDEGYKNINWHVVRS